MRVLAAGFIFALSLWNQGVATMQAEQLRRGGMGREAQHLRLC